MNTLEKLKAVRAAFEGPDDYLCNAAARCDRRGLSATHVKLVQRLLEREYPGFSWASGTRTLGNAMRMLKAGLPLRTYTSVDHADLPMVDREAVTKERYRLLDKWIAEHEQT